MGKRAEKNQFRRWVPILLAAALALSAGISEAGPCERAFIKCLDDPFLSGIVKTVYCANGYIFCKKYLGS